MAVITRRGGIPLFSSIKGALRWAKFNRLKDGYHVHYWEGKKGYMGGDNHSEIAKRRPMKIDPIIAAQHEANNFLQRNPIQSRQQVQPEQQEPLEQIIRPVPPVIPVQIEQLEELEQPVQPVQPVQPITRTTTYSGGGGGGGY